MTEPSSASRSDVYLTDEEMRLSHFGLSGPAMYRAIANAAANKVINTLRSEQQRSQFIPAFLFWYHRDGSVGGLSQVVEEHDEELRTYEPAER